MLDANFWQNKSKSQRIIKEKKLYEELVNSYEDSLKSLIDLNELKREPLKITEVWKSAQSRVNLDEKIQF